MTIRHTAHTSYETSNNPRSGGKSQKNTHAHDSGVVAVLHMALFHGLLLSWQGGQERKGKVILWQCPHSLRYSEGTRPHCFIAASPLESLPRFRGHHDLQVNVESSGFATRRPSRGLLRCTSFFLLFITREHEMRGNVKVAESQSSKKRPFQNKNKKSGEPQRLSQKKQGNGTQKTVVQN